MMRRKYLYKSHYQDNQKPIYRLTKKLTRGQWKDVEEYFKYYNIGDLHGWGTTHPVLVIKSLYRTEINEYDKRIRDIEELVQWSTGTDKIVARGLLDKVTSNKEQYIRSLI